jgi:hypothetical protein
MRHLLQTAAVVFALTLSSPAAFAAPKPKPAPRPQVGDVLISGGIAPGGNATNSAEFYSASKKKFLATGSMSIARAGHQMQWMPQSPERTYNQAVVLGGFTGTAAISGTSITYTMNVLDNAEVFYPATGIFGLDQAPEGALMSNGRAFAASIAFPGNLSTDFLQGHVLIIGGVCNASDLESCRTANILHPDDDKITTTSNPKVPIMMETLTNLADGTALMTGGIDDFSGTITNSAEIFNPPNEFFIMLAAPMMEARAGHTATLLNDGTVLIAGGMVNLNGEMTAVDSAEIYNPVTLTFSPVLAPMIAPRVGHTATLLKDGRVLLAGGSNGASDFALSSTDSGATLGLPNASGSILSSAEIYDPKLKTFEPVGGINKKTNLPVLAMKAARFDHTATLLANGAVLLTGGFGPGITGTTQELNSAELFIPNKNKTTLGRFADAGTMISGRALHAATLVEK